MAVSKMQKQFVPTKVNISYPTTSGTTYETVYTINAPETSFVSVSADWLHGRPTGVRVLNPDGSVLCCEESTTKTRLVAFSQIYPNTNYKVQSKIDISSGSKSVQVIVI